MGIRPILSSLLRHRIAAGLIVCEVALACAVLCNAVFMIGQRVESLRWPDAIDEARLSFVNLPTVNKNAAADIPRNLVALRGIAGVEAASIAGAIPLVSGNGNVAPYTASPDSFAGTECSIFLVTDGATAALGTRLVRGRDFTPEEYAGSTLDASFALTTRVVAITESFAHRMWPGADPLGRQIYLRNPDQTATGFTVVGILKDVLTPNLDGLARVPDVRVPEVESKDDREYASGCFFPMSPSTDALQNYILRSAPADRDRVLREAMHLIGHFQPGSVMTGSTFEDARDRRFAGVRSMVHMLAVVCLVMLAVTAFGIVGLSSFWVQQRRRQIGIRRAVGATRGDILRYFQVENLLLTSAGIAIGMGAAFGVNAYLIHQYQAERMPTVYYIAGALILWLLGQLAVLGPAIKASKVPPLVATRSG